MAGVRGWFPRPLLAAALLLPLAAAPRSGIAAGTDYAVRLASVLEATPLIDGHNDLAWELRKRFGGDLEAIDLGADTSRLTPPAGSVPLMTDIPRLRAGAVGGQFWSVWVPSELAGPAAVKATLEQMDLVKRMGLRWPQDLAMAYSAAEVRRIHASHRVASLIGIEGGHQIDDSLAVLRQLYEAGARYMTLTHIANNDWADSATDVPLHHGLTGFGREVVREMNRLGMLVDLSHVSEETMSATLEVTEAPVIFSHSSARALVDHPRNVPDEILRRVALNGVVVMVSFAPAYVSPDRFRWDAEQAAEMARLNSPPYVGLALGQPERAAEALGAWEAAHPRPPATLAQVADHIEHVRAVAGIEHVGIGSDFDGIGDTPQGLSGVDGFPALLEELMRRGWSDEEVAKLAGGNVLRVMAAAEATARRLRAARLPSSAVYPAAPGS